MKVLSEVNTFAFVNATISPVRIPDSDFLTVASHISSHGPKTRIQRGQAPLQEEQETEDFHRQRWIERASPAGRCEATAEVHNPQ